MTLHDPRYRGQIRNVTLVGAAVNIMLAALKGVLGWLGGSQAVVADAVHSLSDLATDVAVLVGAHYWSAPADEDHPHGHGRIETLVTAFIGLSLAGAAVLIAWHGIATLRQPDIMPPTWIALLAALISIVVKEGLYRWTVAVGRRARSSAVVANAWHHRSDAYSSIPAAIAVAVAAIWPELAFVDHLGAAVVAIFIFRAGWGILEPALGSLVDRAAPQQMREQIERIAMQVSGVQAVHGVRTRYTGMAIQVDMHVLVNGDLTVRDGHEIAEAVKRRLIEDEPDVVDVVVHLEPNDE
jgi:cation diffusion facilitator family transporter